jgi:hypothetical protein
MGPILKRGGTPAVGSSGADFEENGGVCPKSTPSPPQVLGQKC